MRVEVRKRLAAGGNRLRTIGPSGATRPLKLCGSLLTSCWKEPDSNPRSPVTSSPIFGDTNLLVTNMEQGGVAIGGSRWRHQPRHSPAPVHPTLDARGRVAKFRRRFGLRVPISQAPVDQRLSRPGSAAILTLAPETADIRPMAFPPEIVNAPLRWPKTPGGASTGHVRD